jgi:hypothetical protein
MNKLKVGQELFVVYVGYNTREIKQQTATISKIGNKYFYLHGNRFRDYKFNLTTLKGFSARFSNPEFECYLNQQEWDDKQEHQRLARDLSPLLFRLSLEQLKELHLQIYKTL